MKTDAVQVNGRRLFSFCIFKIRLSLFIKAYALSDVLSGIVKTTSLSFQGGILHVKRFDSNWRHLSGAGLYMALESHVPALLVTGIIMLFGFGIGIITKEKSE